MQMTKKLAIRILGVIAIIVVIFFIAREASAPEETPLPVGTTSNTIPAFDPQSTGKFILDPSTGKEFVSNQLIVEFQSDVSEEDALAVIASVGGVMLQRFTGVPLFLIRLDDPGDGTVSARALNKLKENDKVKNVDRNYLTSVDRSTTP